MDQLIGITANTWRKLLRENNFAVHPRFAGRAAFITLVSLVNSRAARLEKKKFGTDFSQARVEQPLFVLGHWRSGTTLLHDLLSKDTQFAYPTIFQTSNPHTFLYRQDFLERQAGRSRAVKRPMDNVEFDLWSPGEDEFAISAMSLRSPLVGWSFTRKEAFYDRFLSFRQATGSQIDSFHHAMLDFLRKVSWKKSKPLILKSPTHTARIRLILEMFPDARFIHLCRDPFIVFRSTQALYTKGIPNGYLQTPFTSQQITAGILSRYAQMYEAYFEERNLIPEGRLVELRFEDLEQDKLGQVQRIYRALELPGFEAACPAIEAYLLTIQNYKKNNHHPLEEGLRRQIVQAWAPYFEAWGYPTQ